MLLNKNRIKCNKIPTQSKCYGHAGIVLLSEEEHNAWHILFDNGSLEHVVRVLNDKWIDNRFELVIIRKSVMKLSRLGGKK